MHPTRTLTALFILVLALALASPALAAGSRLAPVHPGPGLFARAWSWLEEHLPGLTSLRGEQGGYMDPNGGATSATAPTAPAGAGLTVVRGEQGSYLDPDGHTTPQVVASPTGSGSLAPHQ